MNTPKRLSSLLAILTIALCVVFAFSSCNLFECEHADANNDHLCDECSEALTECADADSNHKCDVCGKVLSECVDANTDHACDVCKANVGEHVNGEDDHTCDYCGEAASECADADNDHLCDICYDVLSECVDANPKDHICDICENRSFGNCNDAEKDHECDYCGGNVGEHADSDPMTDGHNCNYCGESLCADVDTDEDHNCDVCGKNLCTDVNENCVCDDENCGAPLHVDATLDHECDKCKEQVGEHADGTDGNHECDYCFASLCAEGDVVDCKCDGCGAPLHVDAKNNESGEAGSDHKCDNCSVTLCYDSGDRDHNCDVCGKNLCVDADEDHDCDVCEALLCKDCETHAAPIITVYAEGTNCKVNGTNVVKFYGTEASYAVVPEYMASQYIIDLWVVYNAEGTKIAYIENGSEFVPTEGTYYIAPIFIANNLEGIFDTEGSIDVSTGTQGKIDETVITPEWADVDASKKLFIFGSEGHTNNVLASSPNAQVYLTTDPTDAANVVLMVATRNGNTGGLGNTVIATPFDASSKGDGYLMSFDYYLDHNCSSADSTTILVVNDSEGNAFKIGVIVPAGKSMASVTADTATPTEGAFRFQSRHYNSTGTGVTGNDGVNYKDSAGSEKVLLSSDTWYTFQIKIEFNKISTYWSLRGSNEFTLVQEYDFSNFSISERNLVSFEIQEGLYNNSSLCYYDNVWFGKAHECVDANNDHNCDTCSVALCYDGIDADHNCDRCDANLCYEGDIADHNCDVCGATLSECVDNDKTHYCDICGKGGFGEHADGDPMADGHNCNYCGKNLCVDEGKDHACDICNGLVGGECADADKDHNCDYCGARKFGSVEGSTDCDDADKNHKCDYCGTEMNMDKHVDADAADTIYKFAMVQGNLDNAVYYLAGGMDGYYMATTTDASQAINVYLEKTEGGYYLYTLDGETKLYINMVVNDTHVNGAYEATASTVYTYNAESKTIIAVVNGTNYWFGTRNDKTYTTVGPVKVEYNGFYCQFYAESEGSDETSETVTYGVVDTPKAFDTDHLCDYGCGVQITECVDANTDYKCDECGVDLCYDLDKDHICDIEAHKATGEKISDCEDENKDHICDFEGCKKVLSECADGETVDHVCDYCSKYNVAWCTDVDNNHLCDLEACGKALSECADANADHKCDKCGADVCTDANADRFCDNCKNYIPYNFESSKIESNGNLAFSNVNYKSKEDYVTSTSVELNGKRTEGYNASTHLYLEADPDNAANVLLAAQSASGSGLTEDTISDIKFTPTALVEGGDLVVLEFDYNLYKSGANGKNTFRWAYNYANGEVKRVNGTYTTNSNASVRLIADKDGSMKFDIGSWVRIRLVCDNTNKKIYTYLSTDNGATYTLQETVDAYAYDSTIASVDITFVGWGVSATQYFDNVKCVITTAEAYGISFE